MYSGHNYGTDTTVSLSSDGRSYSYAINVDPEEDLRRWRAHVASRKLHLQSQLILKRKNANKPSTKAARKARRKNRGIR